MLAFTFLMQFVYDHTSDINLGHFWTILLTKIIIGSSSGWTVSKFVFFYIMIFNASYYDEIYWWLFQI